MINGKVTDKFYLSSIDFNLQVIHKALLKHVDFSLNPKFIISSVSKYGEELFLYLKNTFKCPTYTIKQELHQTNIKYLPSQKDAIGTDILCKGAWVVNSLKIDALILDVGTATVVQYMNKQQELAKVAITLGLGTIYRNISQIASLPLVTPKKVEHALGTDTQSAIESGVFWGYIGMVNTLLQKSITETKCKNVFITGGLAELILNEICIPFIYNPNIVFEGINMIYQLNKELME
ncbi:Type III pantothenate kinase [Candidatus Hepatincola sp. Av]